MTTPAQDPRYPIGKYQPESYSDALLADRLNDIRFLPATLENTILNLDEAALESPYREGGWSIRQLIHHVADSHLNAYMRFKLALTEDVPTIKTYDQGKWASLADSELPVNISLTLLHALHARWYALLKSLKREDWERTLFHPEQKKELSLWFMLGMYSWHGRHHVAHIEHSPAKS